MRAREALESITGLPLTDLWKPIFFVFEFGEQKPFVNSNGHDAMRADLSLNVFCEWRILLENRVVLGSDDYRSKRRFFVRKTPPAGDKRPRWAAARALFEVIDASKLVCTGIQLSPSGILQFELSNGYSLEILQCSSSESASEWEFNDDAAGTHFAVHQGSMYFIGPN